ncbi:hypothetical protein M406DRAFT_357433 [Cryphonectria parasitica EP155]|uniref:HMG box domain-containing protein n=1 Tax=Cryphonectria parasitica (strain ATCC 38755 / EP155) TaxID=660469 RepID=A0A9P4XWY1_CRYP1|nr:uncharacterized protein M406DRAFT_357433 [Cryphonectria parasitica EP155]KAF3762386.1 hypothetical protein M406DRAFT_357433 [Cryphonectria parasitica EP155]
MLMTTMQSAVAQALRGCGLTITSRAIVARRSFLVAPSYSRARLAVRGYATATATQKATTTRAAKKPAAKKTTTTTTRKAAAGTTKKVAASKKPKAKAKAKAPAPKKKKVVDPEKKKAELKKELKKIALLHKEPKKEALNSWQVYLFDHIKGDKTLGKENFGPKLKELSAAYKDLPAAELQRLDQRSQQNRIKNAANYKQWVESHSVADIHAANNARRRLIYSFGMKLTPSKIVDERKPKQPATAFSQYIKSRNGVFATGNARDNMKQLSAEWRALSLSDRKPYSDLYAAEAVKYRREQERVGL